MFNFKSLIKCLIFSLILLLPIQYLHAKDPDEIQKQICDKIIEQYLKGTDAYIKTVIFPNDHRKFYLMITLGENIKYGILSSNYSVPLANIQQFLSKYKINSHIYTGWELSFEKHPDFPYRYLFSFPLYSYFCY